MMANRLSAEYIDAAIRGDATPAIKGFLYQFLVALKLCFEIEKDQSLYLEKYGDVAVTFDYTGEGISLEIKKHEGELTPLHHNLLNTIFNWCQENFHQENYSNLVIFTTQTIKDNSDLSRWNETDGNKRYNILKGILEKHKEQFDAELKKLKEKNKDASLSTGKQKILNQIVFLVSNDNKSVVQAALSKSIIVFNQPDLSDLYKKIKSQYTKHLEERKGELFIATLLGFIITPTVVEKGWKISYNEFVELVRELSEDFSRKIIPFPKIADPTNEEKQGYDNKTFVNKLKKVQLDSMVAKAIKDFVKTNSLILEHISGRLVRDQYLEQYKEDLYDLYEANYTMAKEHFYYDKDKDVIKASKEFYKEMLNSSITIKLEPFEKVQVYFSHGMLHILADDETLDVKWEISNESGVE